MITNWREVAPLPILEEGDPRLLEVARAVGAVDAAALAAAASLAATLEAFREAKGFGRAIAAPQVGIGARLVVVNLGAGPFAVFDPRISWRSEETILVWDDCLSVPASVVQVERAASITLEFTDEAGQRRRWPRLPEDVAELLQHELDHLDGVLMTGRAVGPGAIQPASRWAELVGAGRPEQRPSVARAQALMARMERIEGWGGG